MLLSTCSKIFLSLNIDIYCIYDSAISRPSNISWPLRHQEVLKKCGDPSKIVKMDSERALLTFFLAKLSKIDPDLIIGHDICSHVLSTFVNRLEANKIQNWSKIGRLRRTLFPKKVTVVLRLLIYIKQHYTNWY